MRIVKITIFNKLKTFELTSENPSSIGVQNETKTIQEKPKNKNQSN